MNHHKGFALLYAILLAGAVLSIGMILMDIITKQLVLSSINRNSEISYYYSAHSGRECLKYYISNTDEFYIDEDGTINYFPNPTLRCLGADSALGITMTQIESTDPNKIIYTSSGNISLSNGTAVFLKVEFRKACQLKRQDCTGETAIDKAWAIAQADGFNLADLNNPRATKRTAISVFSW